MEFQVIVLSLGDPCTVDVPAARELDLDYGGGLYVTSFHASGRTQGCNEGQLSGVHNVGFYL